MGCIRPDPSFHASTVFHLAENDLRSKRARRFEQDKLRPDVNRIAYSPQPIASTSYATPEPEANPVRESVHAVEFSMTVVRT